MTVRFRSVAGKWLGAWISCSRPVSWWLLYWLWVNACRWGPAGKKKARAAIDVMLERAKGVLKKEELAIRKDVKARWVDWAKDVSFGGQDPSTDGQEPHRGGNPWWSRRQ